MGNTLTRSLDEHCVVATLADWDCLDDEVGRSRGKGFGVGVVGEIMNVRDGRV
jgi:hypothetical protein